MAGSHGRGERLRKVNCSVLGCVHVALVSDNTSRNDHHTKLAQRLPMQTNVSNADFHTFNGCCTVWHSLVCCVVTPTADPSDNCRQLREAVLLISQVTIPTSICSSACFRVLRLPARCCQTHIWPESHKLFCGPCRALRSSCKMHQLQQMSCLQTSLHQQERCWRYTESCHVAVHASRRVFCGAWQFT